MTHTQAQTPAALTAIGILMIDPNVIQAVLVDLQQAVEVVSRSLDVGRVAQAIRKILKQAQQRSNASPQDAQTRQRSHKTKPQHNNHSRRDMAHLERCVPGAADCACTRVAHTLQHLRKVVLVEAVLHGATPSDQSSKQACAPQRGRLQRSARPQQPQPQPNPSAH